MIFCQLRVLNDKIILFPFPLQLRVPDLIIPVKLHTVLLAHNEIQDLGEIHPNILQLLQHLDLSNNQLKEILYKKHLSKSRMLKTLDVSFNNITYVEDCAFCNTSLRTLNFAFNGMRSLNPDMVNYVSTIHTILFMSRPVNTITSLDKKALFSSANSN